jgi:flagellar hook assembly protein FlgD
MSDESGFLRDTVFEGDLQVMVSTNVGVEEDGSSPPPQIPLHVFPNPFTDQIDISFSQMQEGQVIVTLYDASGRRVRDLFHGYARELNLPWDGKDNSGKALPGGVYFCRIVTSKRTIFERIVLQR